MGSRAIIKTETGHIGVYLHWNGGRDSVEAFLKYCDLRGFRSPETDGYGWARFAQVVGNFFGGGLSIGMVEVNSGDGDGKYCDNGAYIIKGWEIVGREHFDGKEQREYDLCDMLLSIDEAQPEQERIGEYLKGYEVPTSDLRIGDEVVFMDWNNSMKTGVVIGFGGNGSVNGQSVKGLPYMNLYGNDHPETNIKNYIRTETARKVAPKAAEEQKEEPKESPVEIFINDALNGIELKFSRKPDEQTREALKASGWRWHRKRCVWYTKNNPGNLEMAHKIAEAVTK